MAVQVRAFTPQKLGLYQRNPPLLPHAVTLRGKRIRNTKTYQVRRPKFHAWRPTKVNNLSFRPETVINLQVLQTITG